MATSVDINQKKSPRDATIPATNTGLFLTATE
jgi:hypothetical protein